MNSMNTHAVNAYKVQEVDADGRIVSEHEVAAHSFDAVLRQLKDVCQTAQRIEVYNLDGDSAGEINADYWRQKMRRRR